MNGAEAREQASRAATGLGFTERLAERVGAAARAAAVFGDAVEQEGVTVIPVARAKWGFGGGSGGRGEEEGAGGGGGASVSPVGYIELRAGEARFRRIYGRGEIAAAAVACGLTGVITLRMVLRGRSGASRSRPTLRGLTLQTAGVGVRFLKRRVGRRRS